MADSNCRPLPCEGAPDDSLTRLFFTFQQLRGRLGPRYFASFRVGSRPLTGQMRARSRIPEDQLDGTTHRFTPGSDDRGGVIVGDLGERSPGRFDPTFRLTPIRGLSLL
ncbi:MAG: hypothetical protein GY788_24195 [bacterium]|nr:hypothetical protein [bacterium]